MPAGDLNNWRTPSVLVLIFVLLAAGIVAVGCRYYRNYERQFRDATDQQLSAITELKADELFQYRKERLWDADTLFENAAFSGLVRRFLDHPEDAEARQQIREWAGKYLATVQYDLVCLFDAQGVIRMSIPAERPPISSDVSRRIPEVLRSGKVAFQDFHRNEHDQRVYLTLLVPVFDGTDPRQALGVLALRINPETYLYPFLKRWPTFRQTAETLLVRREGNAALFLNDLKFQTNTALNLRISIENTNVPAVKAVLGQKGIVEGMDYRGVPSLAALQAIPDSPWFLVARMDAAEVYAPLRERLSLTILLVGLLLISAGLGIGAIWRRQRVRFYKERYEMAETLRESEERFRRVFEEGPTGMATLDETFHFIQVNPAFAAMLGYSEKELQTMSFTDITHPDHVQKDVEQVRRLMRGELSVYRTEKRYITRSGKELWGQVQVAVVRNADGAFHYFLAIVGDITERKQAEENLRRSETKFRTLYNSTSDAVMLLDEKGFFDCNLATLAVYGFATREEFCSKHPADVSPPVQPDGSDSRALANQRIAVAREKGTNHFEWIHKRADTGETFTADVLLNAMELDGKPVLQAVVRDITERKRMEESLRYERTLMATLMDSIPAAVYFKDAASHFLRVNRAHARKFGLSDPAQLTGKSDADFFSGEHAQQALADEREILRTGQPLLNVEEKETWLDGTISWVLTTKLLLRDAAGRGIGTCGISLDITDRKQMEQALAERTEEVSQRNQELAGANAILQQQIAVRERIEKVLEGERNLLRTLIDDLPDYVYAKDAEGRFTIANMGVARQFGFSSPNEVIGKSDFDLFPRDLAAQYHIEEQEILRSGQGLHSYEGPTVDASKPEKNRWVSTTKVPLRNDLGEITGFVGLGHDITERKRMEEALQQSSRELQARNDELARFTYTVSHDLKSPLVTIKAFLGYLEQDAGKQDAEGMKKDLEYIYGAADKMGRLLDELLDLARVGRKMNPPEEVPLQVVVKDALDLVAGWIIQRNVEVVVTKEPVMLCGDRSRLVEVFQNLVDNATKFMGDQPKPRVEIGVETAGDESVFFVRDNGMGIDPRYLPKVFGLFEKYDPASKGTGIGLALVKRIVEVHGGKVWVESAGIGKGATFRFTLAKTKRHPAQP